MWGAYMPRIRHPGNKMQEPTIPAAAGVPHPQMVIIFDY